MIGTFGSIKPEYYPTAFEIHCTLLGPSTGIDQSIRISHHYVLIVDGLENIEKRNRKGKHDASSNTFC